MWIKLEWRGYNGRTRPECQNVEMRNLEHECPGQNRVSEERRSNQAKMPSLIKKTSPLRLRAVSQVRLSGGRQRAGEKWLFRNLSSKILASPNLW
jgi:hypothetical protein